MRFIKKEELDPPHGTIMHETGFRIIPVTIGNETRWLERVTVEYWWDEGYGAWHDPHWVKSRFVDEANPTEKTP